MMLPSVDITIEFAPPLAGLAEHSGDEQLRSSITSQLQLWMEDMGVPARPQVTLTRGEVNQGPGFLDFAVLVQGCRCAYTRSLIARVYESATHRTTADYEREILNIRKWLRETLADHDHRNSGEREVAVEFLAELVVEAVMNSPEGLIGP